MKTLYSLYLLILFVAGVSARGEEFEWYGKSLTVYSCFYEINYSKGFKFCQPGDRTCACTNENAMASLAGCLTYKNRNTTEMIHNFVGFCQKNLNITVSHDWFDKAITHFNLNAKDENTVLNAITSSTRGGDSTSEARGGNGLLVSGEGNNSTESRGGNGPNYSRGRNVSSATKRDDSASATRGADNASATRRDNESSAIRGGNNASATRGGNSASETEVRGQEGSSESRGSGKSEGKDGNGSSESEGDYSLEPKDESREVRRSSDGRDENSESKREDTSSESRGGNSSETKGRNSSESKEESKPSDSKSEESSSASKGGRGSGERPSATIVNFPIRFSPKNMDYFEDIAKRFLLNFDNSIWYGVSTFGFWFIILLVSSISHWTKVLFPGSTKKLTGPVSNFYRQYISMPALLGKTRAQAISGFKVFGSLIPTRFEMIVISLFYIFIVIIHAVHSKGAANDPIYGSAYMAEIRYSADRTGIVATFMMPLLFLFAGRNNFLQWITGINYSTFLCYHRHIARIMFMLVVIHSVNYTILLVWKQGFAAEMAEPWLYWGLIATIVGGIMLIQSILYLRRNWYELFLLVHIVMAVLYVVGTWIHIDEFGYGIILYPTIAVWSFDRIVRICRLVYFGFPEVTIKLVGDETIKMSIPKPKHWKIIPGGHAFVHFIKPTYFWQSHPFTFTNCFEEGEDKIVMYMKVKGGVTHSLYKLLKKSPSKMATMRVGIEGPYGESTPAKYSDKAVFIAGGNGIPGIYSEVVDISLRLPSERKSQLKLIWVIRDYNSLIWFYDELLKLKDNDIKTTLFVTRPNNRVTNFGQFNKSESSQEGSIKSGYKEINPQPYKGQNYIEEFKAELSHIKFKERRPNFEQLIHDEIEESPGSIAFVACGHPAMVDEVRYQSCRNIDNPYNKRVDFYEQLQVWA